jgi:hypothetical protein
MKKKIEHEKQERNNIAVQITIEKSMLSKLDGFKGSATRAGAARHYLNLGFEYEKIQQRMRDKIG